MYGSDLPVSHLRAGRLPQLIRSCGSTRNSPVWSEKHMQVTPALVAWSICARSNGLLVGTLTDSAVEDIFWNNAAQLFGVA